MEEEYITSKELSLRYKKGVERLYKDICIARRMFLVELIRIYLASDKVK